MGFKYILVLTLIFALAWKVAARVNPDDPRYLQCHENFEVCNSTNCCNSSFSCQTYVPAPNRCPLFPGEKQCLPTNRSAGGFGPAFANRCHGPLEVCYSLGCCDSDYTCAPYQPAYSPHRPPLFPCEYRCEFTANITNPTNVTARMCGNTTTTCATSTSNPSPNKTCTTNSQTTCPRNSTANCATTAKTTCMNSADNTTTTSVSNCTTTTT